ncbi:MAG: AbrB/MazE/SpoVT family DNA-binding domain-containing protein [Methanobacteriota archaeon]
MSKCPVCGKGSLKKAQVEESMFGVPLGRYQGEVCDCCGESFLDETAMRKIEARAKELGIWGLSKNLKLIKTGNSLSVRIPAKIARFLELSEGKDVVLYPDGKKRIVVEVT